APVIVPAELPAEAGPVVQGRHRRASGRALGQPRGHVRPGQGVDVQAVLAERPGEEPVPQFEPEAVVPLGDPPQTSGLGPPRPGGRPRPPPPPQPPAPPADPGAAAPRPGSARPPPQPARSGRAPRPPGRPAPVGPRPRGTRRPGAPPPPAGPSGLGPSSRSSR